MDEWERCRGWIEAALEASGETHTAEDVLHEVLCERAQLWPFERSAVVTQIHDYPQRRHLRIWLAGGDLDELKGRLRDADEWAARLGCDAIEVEGRRGWERILADYGYRLERVVLRKDIYGR